MKPAPEHRVCLAPMLDWTDRHFRYFLRLITRHTLLYTEMVTTGALLHGDADYHLRFHCAEHPLALQLGGSEPEAMGACAAMAQDYGYDEININVGCPSDRVHAGRFGACLMAEPALVGDCVTAMQARVEIPVTVKCRIGIDDQDSEADLHRFIDTVRQAGCRTFIVHARKAWLQGLSPKENRDIPPLDYARVYRLKQEFPGLEIVINGGIHTLDEAEVHLHQVDGVMIGREAYHNPFRLSEVGQRFYGETIAPPSRRDVLQQMLGYIKEEMALGTAAHHITRHMLGLFHGQPGARRWRQLLGELRHAGFDELASGLMGFVEKRG